MPLPGRFWMFWLHHQRPRNHAPLWEMNTAKPGPPPSPFGLIMQSCLSAKMGKIKISWVLNSCRKFEHNRLSTLSSKKGDGSQRTDRRYKGCGCIQSANWSAETKTTEEYIDYREGLWDHGEISSHDVSSYSPLFIIDESQCKRERVGEREWLSKREREHTLCSLVSSGPYFGIWMLNILGARRLMMYTMQKYLSLYILDIQI